MIKLQIIGNLGKDCIVKEVNGRTVINYSVAHTEKFKDSSGMQKERTTWVECAYWTDRTAIAPYLKKGQLVYSEGSPEADAYMNRDNQAAATLRMRVREVQLLGGRTDNNDNDNQTTGDRNYGVSRNSNEKVPAASEMEEAADDLPF